MEDHPLKVENVTVTVKTGTCTVIIRVVFHDNYLDGGQVIKLEIMELHLHYLAWCLIINELSHCVTTCSISISNNIECTKLVIGWLIS